MKKNIIVIGGGLAGSLLCNALAEYAEVTLLETGKKDSVEYPKVQFDNKKLAEVSTFCFGGGGTTNLWHNGLIPINVADVISQEFAEVLENAQKFTDEAASALFFNQEPYSCAYNKSVSETTDIAEKVGVFTDGIDCLIYPKEFKKLSLDPRVHDVYSVTNIRFVSDGKRIKAVNYTADSKEFSTDVSDVIVSAGALGTPKILRDLLKDESSLNGLGTGFIDHPMGFVGKVLLKKEVSAQIRQLSMLDKGHYLIRTGVRLKSTCGQYTCCAFFRPAMTMDNRLSIYKYKSLLGASTGWARIKNALSWKILHPDIISEIMNHLIGINVPTRVYNILFIAEQKRGQNRVYYDANGLKVDWSISAEELATYRSILEKLKCMLLPISEEVNIETGITEDWLWSCAHHSGTTSVGDNLLDLVDKDLKLKCCDNVFVCDGSVIQEHSYANTGLTIGQLAMRLARRVLDASAP